MKALFAHSDTEASNIRTFWFRPERQLDYTPGQCTELTLKHDHPDDRGIKRWFTLSSAPGQDLVSITTKYAGDDKTSTFKRTLWGLQPGSEVQLTEAMGDFVLPKDPTIPLVLIAGGIGLTPFHSMFEWLAARHERRAITFLYDARTEAEIIFRDTFARAGIEPIVVVTEPSTEWHGEHGPLDAPRILALTSPPAQALFYLSGPELMIETFEKALKAIGLRGERIVTDTFPGYNRL